MSKACFECSCQYGKQQADASGAANLVHPMVELLDTLAVGRVSRREIDASHSSTSRCLGHSFPHPSRFSRVIASLAASAEVEREQVFAR